MVLVLIVAISGCEFGSAKRCKGAKVNANSHELNAVGVAHQGAGQLEDAAACYAEAILKKPSFLIPRFNVGTLHMARNNLGEAIEVFSSVVRLQPLYPSAYYNMGSAWYKLGDPGQAVANFRKAVEVDPNYVNAHSNLATVLQMQGDLDGSKRHCEISLKIDPLFSDGWMKLGNVLKAQGQLEEALQAYRTATALAPWSGSAQYNLGVAYWAGGRFKEALQAYADAIRADPGFPSAHYNMGLCYQSLGSSPDAVAAFQTTTRLDPRSGEAYNNLGTSLDSLGRLPEAIKAYELAMVLLAAVSIAEPSVLSNLFQALQAVCDWRQREHHLYLLTGKLEKLLQDPNTRLQPFHGLSFPFSAELALRVARHHARQHSVHDRGFYRRAATELGPDGVLRVGYLVEATRRSAPVQQALRTMLSMHDRGRVHCTVYSLYEDDPALLADLMRFADEFRDLSSSSWHSNGRAAALEAADAIASDHIHIALHLSDPSQTRRHAAVLALRVAPIQVELGTVASTGAEFVDYIISDRTISPPDYQDHYSERVVLVAGSALLIDVEVQSALETAEETDQPVAGRSELGVSEQRALLCSFGEAFKLTPALLDVWARALRQLQPATLWLPRYNALAEENLRVEARARGLSDQQIIFSPPGVDCDRGHCTRQSGSGALMLSTRELRVAAAAADVALDTGPYQSSPGPLGALLWAGLPCVTLPGERMPSRRGASQLIEGLGSGAGVANSEEEYSHLAVALAIRTKRDRESGGGAAGQKQEELKAMRQARLFDARRWMQELEKALRAMWEDWSASEWGERGGPRHIRLARGRPG